jgi:hypothetical protein
MLGLPLSDMAAVMVERVAGEVGCEGAKATRLPSGQCFCGK